MNKLEKDNIMHQIDCMEQEYDVDTLKELIQYLKKDVETC